MSPVSKTTSTTASPDKKAGALTATRTICKTAEEVYAFCRDLSRLPEILQLAATIRESGRKRFELVPKGPEMAPATVTLTDDRPGRMIAWNCVGESFPHEGRVVFAPAPGDEGTEVTITLSRQAGGSKVREAITSLRKHGTETSAAAALRRIKALLEAGEIPTIDGQPVGEPQKSQLKK